MSSRRVADALAAPTVPAHRFHASRCAVGGVGEFSVGDGVFDDVTDRVNPVREGCAVDDGGFEGEFHSCAKVGVLGNQGH